MTETRTMKHARWWMRRRWRPRSLAEYMATPVKIGQRDRILAACDAYLARSAEHVAEEVTEPRDSRGCP